MKIKLQKQATRSGCTSFSIMVDGEIKGTVQKVSYAHHRQMRTSYTVWMGRDITLQPDLHWPAYIYRLDRGKEFKQQALSSDRDRLENGHQVRKRMLSWIQENLA